MKQLLLLISIFISPLYSESLYTIKKNDTLYSIAKDFNLEIKDIFLANKEIGLNPDFINPGSIIYLPEFVDDIYSKVCSPYGSHDYGSHSLEDEDNDICLNTLIQNLDTTIFDKYTNFDTNTWDIYFSDIGYSYFIIHKFGEISSAFDSWEEVLINDEAIKYINLIIEAASKGSELPLLFLSEEYFLNDHFRNKTADIDYLNTWDSRINPKDLKVFCSNNYNNFLNIKIQNLKIAYLANCARYFHINGDIANSTKYDQIIYETFLNFDNKFIHDSIISDLANFAYRSINSKKQIEAINAIDSFIESTCGNCNKYKTENSSDMPVRNFYNAIVELSNKDNPTEKYLWYGLTMLDLNYSSAFYELNYVSDEVLVLDREHSIKLIDSEIQSSKTQFYKELFSDTLMTVNSDTGLKFLNRGKCELANEYLYPVFEYYKTQDVGSFHYGADDILSEPIRLMNCFANKGIKFNYSFYKDYLDKAQDKHQIKREIHIILLDSIELLIKYKKNLNVEKKTLINLINSALVYADKSLNSMELEYYEMLIVNLYKVAANFKEDEIFNDLFKLSTIKENFLNRSKFRETLSDNNSIKRKIEDNEAKIREITNSIFFKSEDYEKILTIVNENKELFNKTIELDRQTSKYYNNNTTLQDLRKKLGINEFIIQFILDSDDGGVVNLIGSKSSKIFEINKRHGLENMIYELNSSMNSNRKFDYKKSNEIFNALFKEALNEIPKEATLYLLGGYLESLAPYILIKNYDATSLMTDSERIFQSDWLIKYYTFVKLDYINFNKKNTKSKFLEPFLGYGNSSTLNWVGLPNLEEVNGEIINLAITSNSNKNNILIDNLATKENFLKRIQNPTNKIVISTHAVPRNWLGLTKEPALVFNSYKGDIFLSPSEIIQLNIDSEMIVLSSCNANTKGFNEIPKAFLTAGAQTVVYTNWNLDSKFAGDFTSSFFSDLWYFDTPKHIALRNTSLKFLNDYSNSNYSNPSFWGNFSIVYSNLN